MTWHLEEIEKGSKTDYTPSGKILTYGEKYGTLPVPSTQKSNCVFAGWYLNPECTGTVVTSETKVSVSGNHTLYAKWEHDTFISNLTGDIFIDGKYIYGEDLCGMSADELSNLFTNSNIRVSINTAKASTGTTINLVDDTGTVYDTLTVVIFGDINGDGCRDVIDAALCEKALNKHISLEGAYFKAADINSDNGIDIGDYSETVNKALS